MSSHTTGPAAVTTSVKHQPAQPYSADPRDTPYESCSPLGKALVLAFVLVAIGYLAWRTTTINQEHPIFSWLVYGAEAYGVLGAFVHVFIMWRLTERTAPPAPKGLSVDVFVTCFNEPVNMLRRTLLLARDMDYPHQTWLLDDGNRDEMRELAERLGVRYLRRPDNTHAKAGNLNHALGYSSADFVAMFDADHAPRRDFLCKTLGYFLDQRVALVQTPQEFFNLNSFQHRLRKSTGRLWTEQALFFKVLQRGKDHWNAAFFCGTCAVVRRSALDQIGQFAVGTVTEDLHTSIRLHKAGFLSVYHAEPLAFGIAPAQVTPFLAQRIRWGQGAMQVLRKEGVLLTPHLTLAQKLNYFASITTYFDGWQKAIFWMAPCVVLLTGWLPIDANGWVFLCWFIPFFVLSMASFEELARGYGNIFYTEQYNFARFAAFAWATLGLLLGPRKFHVTNKAMTQKQHVLFQLLPQWGLIALSGAAIVWALYRYQATGAPYLPEYAFYFNLLWVTVNLVGGISVMRHIARTEKYRYRADYRFDMPLPLALETVQDGQATLDGVRPTLTIENISPDGCYVLGDLPHGLRAGQMLQGMVSLPGGAQRVRLETVSQPIAAEHIGQGLQAVRCRLQWDQTLARDHLEKWLFGNDLQWHLQQLSERGTTPSDFLRGRWLGLEVLQDMDWRVCEVLEADNPQALMRQGMLAMPRNEGLPQRVLMFESVAQGALVKLYLTSPLGVQRISAKIDKVVELTSTDGSLYAAALTQVLLEIPGQPVEQTQWSHTNSEESSWTHMPIPA